MENNTGNVPKNEFTPVEINTRQWTYNECLPQVEIDTLAMGL